jgi:hypothetical protein
MSAPAYSASRSDESTSVGLRARWRLVPSGWRVVILVVGAVVVAGGLVRITSVVTEGSSPEGPGSSSFSPTAEGLAGYSQLLGDDGYDVNQLTTSLATSNIPLAGTVIVAAPTSWAPQDSVAIGDFLDAGGRVVMMGEPPAGALSTLLAAGASPVWSSSGIARSASTGSGPLVYGVSEVDSVGPGSWSDTGSTSPLLSSGDTYLALSAHVGSGTLVLVASPAPVQDRLLDSSDNAAFALDIAGAPGTAVYFDEYDHGYGRSGNGLGGLPGFWKAALWIAFAAVLVWMWSAFRRLGPPEVSERVLPPPRVLYVDAMATLLSTAPPEDVSSVASPVRNRGREALVRLLGLPKDAPDDAVIRAAAAAGIEDALVKAVIYAPRSAEDLVAAGRASAELSRRGWG